MLIEPLGEVRKAQTAPQKPHPRPKRELLFARTHKRRVAEHMLHRTSQRTGLMENDAPVRATKLETHIYFEYYLR
jgi:hypothetical protein